MGRCTFRDTTGPLSQHTHFGFMFLLKPSSLVAPIFCEAKLFFVVVVVFEEESQKLGGKRIGRRG